MECTFWNCIQLSDLLAALIGSVLSGLVTFFLIYYFKPRIKLGEVKIDNGKVKIPVINKSCCYAVTNVLIEATFMTNKTFHLKLDRNHFILIPKDNNGQDNPRVFQARNFEDTTLEMMNPNESFDNIITNKLEGIRLRVRIHANHEFTNFGKAFEFNYRYNNGQFTEIVNGK